MQYDNMTVCVRGGAKCAQLADCSTAKHELQLRCMDLTKNTDDPGIYSNLAVPGMRRQPSVRRIVRTVVRHKRK
jgi:hypothetical protein